MAETVSRVHQDDPSFVRPVQFHNTTLISQTNSEVLHISSELVISIRLICPYHKHRIGVSSDVHIGVCYSSWIIEIYIDDGSINLDGSRFDASFPDKLECDSSV